MKRAFFMIKNIKDNKCYSILLKTSKGLFRIKADNILYVESRDFYCTLHLVDGGSFDYNQRLYHFERLLCDNDFMLISRSCLVNITHIAGLHHIRGKKWSVVLQSADGNRTELDIAYRRFSQVKTKYAALTNDMDALT